MKYILRDYQKDASEAALKHFKAYRKPFLLVLATGAGKSIIIADIADRLNQPLLVLCPSKELLEQNHQKMIDYGIDGVDVYSASVNRKVVARITLATIGSIYRKPEEFKHFKYVVVDEAHGVNSKGGMYKKFFKDIGNPKVCGLTATPYRMETMYETAPGGYKLATSTIKICNRIHPFFFGPIVYKKEMSDLMQENYLSPIEYFEDKAYVGVKMEVNTTGADYTQESLERFGNTVDSRLCEIVKGCQSRGMAKRGLIFVSSTKVAHKALDELRSSGIDIEIVTAKTPKKDREKIVSDYRAGRLRWLINFGVFTTGLDVPEIDCIIMARPTMSVALLSQMIGRGVRVDPSNKDKVLKVIDMSGFMKTVGRVETIRLEKESDGFRDCLVGDKGRIDNTPLKKFRLPDAKPKSVKIK